jgi:hypothetical protein
MSGVSRESKIFYSVGPCQLYDLNTYVRLMVIKKQKHWTSRTTMRNESVPEPFKEQISYSQTLRTHTATNQEHQRNMLYAEEISQK